ncbi:DNA adenine methylase [Arsenicibacter rosenii]|uniref:DNA adenine methylase n=1 Tax=Arsenicibacter rosenii TaxID=1750698 RepID=A0A1S2VA74_9BACT|nr:DNA adenine methylase [Arsenicibacter rosenii]OIN55631.1 hypothetical protein BLX24_29035 [Arsenicibacter rosenii]
MKPFDTYFGGKSGSGTYQTIINQIPPHELYIEPFVGNGGIFRNKRPAECSLLADLDPTVVDAWQQEGIKQIDDIFDFAAGSNIFLVDALDLLSTGKKWFAGKKWFDRKNAFIYLDPPYPLSTRASYNRYNHELTDQDHELLLRVIDSYSEAQIAISTYPNDLYGTMLADWRRIEYSSTTRGGQVTEWLFCNYPEPTELHDYRYVGADYRERERIAKKVRRHVAKFRKLPELERKAIIQAIQEN